MIFIISTNLLAIATFYLFRYMNRSNKSNRSLRFWIKENWPELLATLLLNITLMVFLMHPDTNIDGYIEEVLPKGIVVPIKLAGAYGIGLVAAWRLYVRVNKLMEGKNVQNII